VLPGAEYSFEVTTSTGGLESADRSETWRPLDRIEVTSLMWQEGMVEGDPASAAEQHRVDMNRAAQLEALLGLLRGARGRSIGSLREQIAREPDKFQAAGARLRAADPERLPNPRRRGRWLLPVTGSGRPKRNRQNRLAPQA
jgi:hypothetical protein